MNNVCKLINYKIKSGVILGLLLSFVSPLAGYAVEVTGITKPRQDVFLAFTVSGKISSMTHKEGDQVRAGEVIATLENMPEEVRLSQLKLEAENTSQISASELELKQREFDLSRMIKAHLEGAAADSELDNAKLEVDVAKLRLKLAKHENQLTKLRYQELEAELERRKLISPVDGVIEIMEIDRGETVEALRPVVRVVMQDYLWVDLMVPLGLLPVIKELPTIPVRFPTYAKVGSGDVVQGNIEYIATLADAASETVKIRIAIKNPKRWPIGTPVSIELPDIESKEQAKLGSAPQKDSVMQKQDSSSDSLFKPLFDVKALE